MSGYRYQLRLRGRLTPSLTAEFSRLALSTTVIPAETVVDGDIGDQAALYGLLRRIEALGIELVEVRRVEQPTSA